MISAMEPKSTKKDDHSELWKKATKASCWREGPCSASLARRPTARGRASPKQRLGVVGRDQFLCALVPAQDARPSALLGAQVEHIGLRQWLSPAPSSSEEEDEKDSPTLSFHLGRDRPKIGLVSFKIFLVFFKTVLKSFHFCKLFKNNCYFCNIVLENCYFWNKIIQNWYFWKIDFKNWYFWKY